MVLDPLTGKWQSRLFVSSSMQFVLQCTTNTSGHSLLTDSQTEDVILPQNNLSKPTAVVKRKRLSLIHSTETQGSKVAAAA